MWPTEEQEEEMEMKTRREEEAEELAPKFRKKSVHTYKIPYQPVKPDYTVMLKNGDGPASKKERAKMRKLARSVDSDETTVPVSGNIFARCCQAVSHAVLGDLADQDIVRSQIELLNKLK